MKTQKANECSTFIESAFRRYFYFLRIILYIVYQNCEEEEI